MFITVSQTIGLPVAAMEEKARIGQVSQVVFDPKNLLLIALEIKRGKWIFAQKSYLATADILDFDKNGIVVADQEKLQPIGEIIRIQPILEQRAPIFGQKAITHSRKTLGKIFDLLLDTETYSISKFYISNIIQERILPADKVEKITSQAVIFSDEVIEQTPLVEPEGAAA